jgi:hypothetical protein
MRKIFISIILLSIMLPCLFLLGCGEHKPDLVIEKIKPPKKLKMGTCNTVTVTVRNKSVNPGTATTTTKLEIRPGKKKLKGKTVYEAIKNIAALGGRQKKDVVFEKVTIPRTEEPKWYTLKAIADDKNTEDEFKEDNNTKFINKLVDESCD